MTSKKTEGTERATDEGRVDSVSKEKFFGTIPSGGDNLNGVLASGIGALATRPRMLKKVLDFPRGGLGDLLFPGRVPLQLGVADVVSVVVEVAGRAHRLEVEELSSVVDQAPACWRKTHPA